MPGGRKAVDPDLLGAGELSLIARLCLSLCCFERYCQARDLACESIRGFVEYMWEWPLRMSTPDAFSDWQEKATELVETGLGDPPPVDVAARLQEKGVDPIEFRKLVESTVEIIWGSFFAASDNEGSLEHLAQVVSICKRWGLAIPPVSAFVESRFTDRNGWGARATPDQRDRWKRLAVLPK
jgi:hypothetical protein